MQINGNDKSKKAASRYVAVVHFRLNNMLITTQAKSFTNCIIVLREPVRFIILKKQCCKKALQISHDKISNITL